MMWQTTNTVDALSIRIMHTRCPLSVISDNYDGDFWLNDDAHTMCIVFNDNAHNMYVIAKRKLKKYLWLF